MKRKINYLLLLIVGLFLCGFKVEAKTLTFDQYKEYDIQTAYIVGDYIFDVYTYGDYGISLEDFARSARTIPANQVEYAYYVTFNPDDEEDFTILDILTGEFYDTFPEINVKYIYWHTIRGAVIDQDFRKLEAEMGIKYTKSQEVKVDGSNFYNLVKRNIVFEADDNITAASYCVTNITRGDCTPNIDLPEASGKSYTKEYTFDSHIEQQYICAKITTERGSRTVCDSARYLVDATTPTIEELESITEIEERTNKPIANVFKGNWGPSEGTITATYLLDGTPTEFTNFSELPVGSIEITVTATSGSGLTATLNKTIVVTAIPDPDNIEIVFGDPIGNQGATHYSSLSLPVTINANYGIAEAKYCETQGNCTPNTTINISGTTANTTLSLETSSLENQRICVFVKSLMEESVGKTVCSSYYRVDLVSPTITENENITGIKTTDTFNASMLFNVTYGVSGGVTTYYYYHPETNAKTQLTSVSALAQFENSIVKIEADALGNNGLTRELTREMPVTADGSDDPVNITWGTPILGGNGEYHSSATQPATIVTMNGIQSVGYCFTSGSTCNTYTNYEGLSGNPLETDISINFPSNGSTQIVCINVTTVNGREVPSCSSTYVLVDTEAPQVVANHSSFVYEYGQTQLHSGYFKITPGISGINSSKTRLYYLNGTVEEDLDENYQFPTGTYTIGIYVEGNNGIPARATATLRVGEQPIAETIEMSFGIPTRAGSGEYNTSASIPMTATSNTAVTEFQYCIFNADEASECALGDVEGVQYVTVSGTTASHTVTFNTTQAYAQGICARAVATQGTVTNKQCSTETFKIDKGYPTIVVSPNYRRFQKGSENHTYEDYFEITGSVSGVTATYKYYITSEPQNKFTFTSTEEFDVGSYTLVATATGGNGYQVTEEVEITITQPPIVPDGSVSFVGLDGNGGNGIYTTASRLINLEATYPITRILYCSRSTGNICTPNIEIIPESGHYSFENFPIPYPNNDEAAYICVKFETTAPSLTPSACDSLRIIVTNSQPTVNASGSYTSWTVGDSINISRLFIISYPIGGSAEYFYQNGTEWVQITNTSEVPAGPHVIKAVATGLNGVATELTIDVAVNTPPPPDSINIEYAADYVVENLSTSTQTFAYNTSASKEVTVTSQYGIQSIKYCISNDGDACIPNKSLNVGAGPLTYSESIEFDSDADAQKLCVQGTTVKGLKSSVVCDTQTVLVDKLDPVVSTTNVNTTYIKGTSRDPGYLFDVTYGVSGGTLRYYDMRDEDNPEPFENLNEVEANYGPVTIGAYAKGGNGRTDLLLREVTFDAIFVTYDYTTNGGTELIVGDPTINLIGENRVAKSSGDYANTWDITATRPGYVFEGWATTPDAHEVIDDANNRYVVSNSVTLYAIFSKEYNATYNIYKEGTIIPAQVNPTASESSCKIYNNETSCEISIAPLYAYSYNDVQFEAIGWSETSGAIEASEDLEVGSLVSISGNVTYYSVTKTHSPNTATFYRIVDGNVITEEKECYIYNAGNSCTIEPAEPSGTYNGLSPVGYVTDLSDPAVDTNYTLVGYDAGKTFYAYYESTYNITFVSGVTTPKEEIVLAPTHFYVNDSGAHEVIENITIPDAQVEQNYNQRGWRLDTYAREGSLYSGNTYHPSGETTFYAIYYYNISLSYSTSYYLSSDLNTLIPSDGSVSNAPSTVTESAYISSSNRNIESVRFTLNNGREYTKASTSTTSYNLIGYKVNGVQYETGQYIELTESSTVYPIFVENSVVVVFDYEANGGTSSTISRITINKATNEPYLNFNENKDLYMATREGYEFAGWSTDRNCTQDTCILLNSANLIPADANPGDEITIYAIFYRIITINYTLRDETGFTLTKTSDSKKLWNNFTSVEFDVPIVGDGLTVDREGLIFEGWSTNVNSNELVPLINGVKYETSTPINNLFTVTRESNAMVGRFYYSKQGNDTLYHVTSSEASCYRYNGANTCTVTPPTLGTFDTYYNYPVKSWTTNKNNPYEQANFNISALTTFFATYDYPVTITYYSGVKGEGQTKDIVRTTVKYTATNNNGMERFTLETKTKTPANIAGYTTDGWVSRTYHPSANDPVYEYKANTTVVINSDETDIDLFGVYTKNVTLTYAKATNDILETVTTPSQSSVLKYQTNMNFDSTGVYMQLANDDLASYQGHEFIGWVKTNSQEILNPGTNIFLTGNVKVHPVWSDSEYTITYHANGGTINLPSGQSNVVTAYMNDPVDLSIRATLSGYQFLGWTTDSSVTTSQTDTPTVNILSELTVGVTNIDLYAVYGKKVIAYWETPNESIFELNVTSTECYIYSKSTRCSVQVPRRDNYEIAEGYVLGGWSTNGLSPAVVGSNQYVHNITNTIHYKAIVQSTSILTGTFNYIMPSYDNNGNVNGYQKRNVQITCRPTGGSSTCDLSYNITTPEYKTAVFKNWETYCYAQNNVCDYSFTLTPTDYYDDSVSKEGYDKKLITIPGTDTSYEISHDVELYARYEEQNTITLVQGRGNNSSTRTTTETAIYRVTDQASVAIAEYVTGSLPMPSSINGWTAIGWSLTNTSSNDHVGIGSQIVYDENKTYNAVYQRQISINYYSNGSTYPVPATQTEYIYYNSGDSDSTEASFVLNNNYQRTGYTLYRWVLSTDTTKIYRPGDTYRTRESAYMDPRWNPINIRITYDPNGGTVSPGYYNVDYDAVIPVPNDPTRTGYEFAGWVVAGTSTPFTSGTINKFTSNTTITAQWTPIEVELTLNPNNGEDPTTMTATYDAALGELPVPEKEGYIFAGWAISGTNTIVTSETISKFTENKTLIALWDEAPEEPDDPEDPIGSGESGDGGN